MNSAASAASAGVAPTRPRHAWRVALFVALLVLAAHGGALFDGPFFDDRWHRETLARCAGSWSWSALIEASTIDVPGQVAHFWWQDQPLRWRYFRPLAIAVMQLERHVAGERQWIIHAFGLAWHWLAALGVYALARRLDSERRLALLGAAIFVFYPHAYSAVSWSAARNAQLSTLLLIWAAAAYAASSQSSAAALRGTRGVALALFVWCLALLTRESALVFPVLAIGIDHARGGWAALRRRGSLLVGMLAIAAAFALWRIFVFPNAPTPALYFNAPTSRVDALETLLRGLSGLFAVVFFTPMLRGLSLQSPQLAAHVALMLALLSVAMYAYLRVTRGVATRWLGPVWICVALAPAAPLFLTPHFAYLPAVGFVLLIITLLSRLRGGWRIGFTVAVLAGVLWSHAAYRYLWRGALRCEQLIVRGVLEERPAETVRSLYFIDLPVVGLYASVAAREGWNRRDFRSAVLTLADHPLAVLADGASEGIRTDASTERAADRAGQLELAQCVVTAVDAHTLRITRRRGGFFAGRSGQMAYHGLRRASPPLQVGARIRADPATAPDGGRVRAGGFEVRVLALEAGLPSALEFRFDEPLESELHAFYVSTPEHPAARLTFAGGAVRLAPAAAAPSASWLAERDVYFALYGWFAGRIASDVLLTD